MCRTAIVLRRMFLDLVIAIAFVAPGVSANAADATFSKGPYIQHLTPDSAVIKWETAAVPDSEVHYREARQGDWQGASEVLASVLHEVRLTGLTPGTQYEYYVRDGTPARGEILGGVVRFRTPGLNPKRARFIAYGDTRSVPDAHRSVIQAMLDKTGDDLDFVVHTGDLVADGKSADQWAPQFFEPAGPLMGRVPIYPVMGNHEGNSELYFELFALPGNERYYSLDFGPLHVSMLDTNSPLDPGSEQYKWLTSDLQQAEAPWKVVVCHHPAYTSGPHGKLNEDGLPAEKPIRDLQQHLVPLFEKFGVAVVFAGHDHLYERSERNGVRYITTGGGGAPLYDAAQNEQNPYSEVLQTHAHHYCLLDVTEERLRMSVYATDGRLIDDIDVSETRPRRNRNTTEMTGSVAF